MDESQQCLQSKNSASKMSMKEAKILTRSVQWIDKECYSYPHLRVTGSTVEALDRVNIFGKEKLKQKYTFTVKIIKMKFSIGIGVVDFLNRGENIWNNNSNWICYCNDSVFCNGDQGVWMGKGFKKGESVTVMVDLQAGSIVWMVGDEIRHSVQNVDKLKEKRIQWVPYFWLCKESTVMVSN